MTKKALVRFDPRHPKRQSSDFLAPRVDEQHRVALVSISTGRVSKLGMVVYTGREIAPGMILDKLKEAGQSPNELGDVLEMDNDRAQRQTLLLLKKLKSHG